MYDIVGRLSRTDKINILNEMKRILDEYGWIQGSHGNCETGFCLDGAILEVVPGHARNDIEYELAKTICEITPMNIMGVTAIWRYNDDHAQTKSDVVYVINRTIKRLER